MHRKLLKIITISFIIVILISGYSIAVAEDYDWRKGTSWNNKSDLTESNYHLLSVSNGSMQEIARFDQNGKGNLQGSTVAGKYLIFAQVNGDSNNTTINVVDRTNNNIISTQDHECFGHANNITYNPDTKKIVISNGNGGNYAAEKDFNIENGELSTTTTNVPTGNTQSFPTGEYSIGGLAYDKDNKRYITKANSTTVRMLDMAYQFENSFSFKESSLTGQGIGYYNNYIYLPYCEAGHENNYEKFYYNSAQQFSALIYIYNSRGDFIKTLYIPRNNILGEIESISFDENGDMICGVQQRRDYKVNGDPINPQIVFYKITGFAPKTESIEVSAPPTKMVYNIGENLDVNGGKIEIKYNERIVSWDENLNRTVTDPKYIEKTIDMNTKGVSITGYNKTKAGKQTVTLTYDKQTVTFDVFVLEDGILKNVSIETYVTDFRKNIISGENVTIKLVDRNNNELEDEDIIKTGDKLQVNANGEIKEYPIAVNGDVDGDGDIDIVDLLLINKHRLNKVMLTDVYLVAGDVWKDGTVNILDLLIINKLRLKKINSL